LANLTQRSRLKHGRRVHARQACKAQTRVARRPDAPNPPDAAGGAADERRLNGGLSGRSGPKAQGVSHGGPWWAGCETKTMTPTAFDPAPAAIEWVHLDPDAPDSLQVGDAVSAAAGGLPIYRVVAVADRQAWVRDADHAAIRLLPIARLHWKIGGSAGTV